MPFQVSPLIGNTPLIAINDSLCAKLETVNPSGSVKDRMARSILDAAEKRGELKPGMTIVEATSGNTGIALSMLAAERGYTMIVVLPSNMSEERKKIIRHFGARIEEVGKNDFMGAVAKRDALVREYRAFNPNQFANPDNEACHYQETGKEILAQCAETYPHDEIAAFVAGTGTGGTLMGVGRALRERFPRVKIVAVEPTESAVMSGGTPHPHLIQGIGDGFIPPLVHMSLVDTVMTISSEDAVSRTKKLASEKALLVGISSGANVLAAERYMEKERPTGIVVTILPDRAERYFSVLG